MKSLFKIIFTILIFCIVPFGAFGEQPLLSKQAEIEINERIREIMSRKEFEGARWGMEFYIPDTQETVFSLNSKEYFTPASSMKIFTAGTAFENLGADYHFHTPVYRTGPVVDGILQGDLVLKASGDLLLGGRINENGTLKLPEPDHSYDISAGAMPVSDDPVYSLRLIADQVAASGIKRIEGSVLVDNSLFREETGEAGGTGAFTVSSMVINDNLIDIVITPASRAGAPAELRISPESSYLNIVNKTVTVATAGRQEMPGNLIMMGPNSLRLTDEVINENGLCTVTLTGEIPLNSRPMFRAFRIPDPARFAEIVLTELLTERGVSVQLSNVKPDLSSLSRFYTPENLAAEIVSPALDVEVLPMLKVSSNPHTVTWTYLIGSIAGGNHVNAREKGKEIQAELFRKTGVIPLEAITPASNNVFGEAADRSFDDEYMPDSFTKFLTYIYRQSYYERFKNALPMLGIDGTLSEIHPDSKAASHVFAKTGTAMMMHMINGVPSASLKKALAGFIELPNGKVIVFSEFLEYSPLSPNPAEASQVMGEIVNIIYEAMTS